MAFAVGDTIAAIATARGTAALAVVRLSGPEALRIADACFVSSEGRLGDAPTRTAHIGAVRTEDGETIDQVVATLFRAPASPTGEDVVEISCHGGAIVPGRLFERLLAAGARGAGPGEFTMRAFVNGKMDLAQAEAVADLIHANAKRAQQVAVRQLKGRFSSLLGRLRDELIEFCGLIELELDFSDTDQTFADLERLRTILKQADGTMSDLLEGARSAELLREGIRVVIGGLPNAGKSTLLNALVGHDRAIVSDLPGTTRDLVEVDLEVDGLFFRLVDTAGIRESRDRIEEEGVRRARIAVAEADVVLYVFDARVGLHDSERHLLDSLDAGVPCILVANKIDEMDGPAERMTMLAVPGTPERGSVVPLSAIEACSDPRALAPLVTALVEAVRPMVRDADESPVLLNGRHRTHLLAARAALGRVAGGLDLGIAGDLLAIDLRVALHELGCITGEITAEDVLDAVFSRFCIGK